MVGGSVFIVAIIPNNTYPCKAIYCMALLEKPSLKKAKRPIYINDEIVNEDPYFIHYNFELGKTYKLYFVPDSNNSNVKVKWKEQYCYFEAWETYRVSYDNPYEYTPSKIKGFPTCNVMLFLTDGDQDLESGNI
jgi:hypothetical protein